MSNDYFISDYKPAKRIGLDELDGTIKLLVDRIDDMQENGEAGAEYYEGAMLALETIRYWTFKYPGDYLTMLETKIQAYTG